MPSLDVVLVNPGSRQQVYQALGSTLAAIEPPVWAGLMATYLRRHAQTVSIIDAEAEELTPAQVAERIERLKPRLVAVVVYGHQPSASTQNMTAAGAICTAIKQHTPAQPVLLVGGHVAALPERTLQEEEVDFVCSGEGPITLLELIQALKSARPDFSGVRGLLYRQDGRIQQTPAAPLVNDLDHDMPAVAWDLLPMDRYRAHNWHCVSEGMRIPTDQGLIKIEELANYADKDGNLSLQVQGSQTSTAYQFMDNGERECLRVTLDNGFELDVTPDHQVKVVRNGKLEWQEAGVLRTGDWCVLVCGNSVYGSDPSLDAESAWTLGFLIGDGYFSTHHRVGFAVTEPTGQRLTSYFENRFGITPRVYPHATSHRINVLSVQNQRVWEDFAHFVDPNHKLRVPEVIFRSGKEVIEAFIDGLMEADGYATRNGQGEYLTTISKELALGLGMLLLNLGKRPSIVGPLKRRHGFANAQDIYRVYVDTHEKTIPCSFIWDERDGKQRIRNGRLGVRRATLAQLEPRHELLDGPFYYRRVKKIEPIGIKRVFDISVAEIHSFSANGFLVHNCFDGLQRQPYAALYTTLGCPYHCSFCCIQAPFKSGEKVSGLRESVNSYRFWSVESVMAQIDTLVQRYGVRNIKIADEMFVLHPKHVLGICQAIIARGYDVNIWAYARVDTVREEMVDQLKRAGVHWLAFGIEAASERVRTDVQKGFGQDLIFKTIQRVRKAGINVIGNYIFGLPEDDLDTMQATLDMALELNCEFANLYSAMAYPGSPLYELAIQQDWPLPERWSGYSQHAVDTLPLPTKYLSGAAVLRFRDQAFQTYFASPRYLEMVHRKFGADTAAHIRQMVSHKLVRQSLAGAGAPAGNGAS